MGLRRGVLIGLLLTAALAAVLIPVFYRTRDPMFVLPLYFGVPIAWGVAGGIWLIRWWNSTT